MTFQKLFAAAALASLLAGCAGPAIPRASGPATAATRPPPPPAAPRITQHNSLIGQSVNAATGMFGRPKLDIQEGAGRKLQFEGSACTLDVYYYAQRQGSDPTATHVDARTPDGRNAEVNSCAQSLQR